MSAVYHNAYCIRLMQGLLFQSIKYTIMLFHKTIQKYLAAMLFVLAVSVQFTFAQESKQEKIEAQAAALKTLIESKDFVFAPQSVTPLSGRTRQLTSYYDLRISKDTITSNLPYFGRAYTAPIISDDAGISFTSTDFEYYETPGKRGGWVVLIKFKNQSQAREMNLTIFDNGRADLVVSSNSRQSVSFSGNIKAVK